jgi:hypothetical protein
LEPVVMVFSAHVAQLDHALGNGFDGDQGIPADEDAQYQPRAYGDVDIRAARCGQVAVGSFSFGRTIGIVPNALADAIVVTTATRGTAAIENPHTSALGGAVAFRGHDHERLLAPATNSGGTRRDRQYADAHRAGEPAA